MKQILSIPIKQVKCDSRGRKDFGDIQALAESIRNLGLIHPVTVTRRGEDFLLLAGERRFRAHILLGLGEIPAFIREELSDIEAKEIELEENVQRRDLHWSEQCELLAQIDELKRKIHGEKGRGEEEGWNLQKTAELTNRPLSSVSESISLAKTLRERPDLKDKIKDLPLTAAKKELKRRLEVERLDRLSAQGLLEISASTLEGDSRKLIKTLAPESIDLMLTDPPFGLDLINESGESSSRQNVLQGKKIELEDNLSPTEAFELSTAVFSDLARVLKPGAHFYIFGSWEYMHKMFSLISLIPSLNLQPYPIVWDKGTSLAPFTGYQYSTSIEYILFGWKSPRVKRLAAPCRNLLLFKPVHSSKKLHEFQKPQDLLTYLITQSSNKGDLVFDPFMGSGSTLQAALSSGRKALGFEKNHSHFLKAQALLQGAENAIC